ncbi:undecaprenyldiphospho-muramoylpentapeptide beta-N-acetylglucosaminyltransferase [Buchnera aphidicola str. APS (Acyrthosiphon pisum)]|uniref:UDP-N-acetylglucosamine--N-acetylmuramyl-(pentapeptide) pyrophosphoryl-undecaprenol N-acetylglucosamine transferase n=2 Tax=Buchnera aphidicola (Acyrthosiphon pisum) TaxID=118099 RepID=MURG_BUCAI|nr:undecaprenyldiphospho-muramoylpentapeptide beta-N-acetylglucosaminyltransferase [Buchnera aphidicola]B8D7B9.1 RecName: Full=UDP-N-acetylglucosamine--N-acetylmuramyl-(pentapeptide) pyrophosphoryl-undecaprenol N-acetylglucosamine transferase; AltName: Full=Undecaprenyl-PP-MurNAc-pentapeptide-UDPGlcNAc GlcNAc transferase [Buchnera aphidicola str. Tuc7 (Acyrthosiphon pisum)]P57311.1 RecName: Full=UDP-N-acetylglucosamine--N-acetylmuramyl-(pentapeptide) pyrophosphoryl-undecaprenol N-acetylglucosamin
MIPKKIIIMAGGSGGHVFPGLTIARYLIEKGWLVNWIGTKNSIESRIIPKYGIKIHYISIKGLRNTSLKNLIISPIYILRAYYAVKKIIKTWSPDIVLGMGGYVSGPGGVASWNCNIPLLLHEQNKIAGITNKWLSRISTKNMQASPGVLRNAEVVGNPVCQSIIKVPNPINRFKNRTGLLRVLVIGGSQGSSILNRILPEVSFLLKEKIIFWHQTGNYELEKTKKKYNKLRLNQNLITSFIKNIASAYEWADLIICRSGALTVSEISIVGLGAIFIPYPHKDKQQHRNAEDLELIGAAKIIDQSNLNTKLIVNILNSLDRDKLFIMAKKAHSLGVRDAIFNIFNVINKISKKT